VSRPRLHHRRHGAREQLGEGVAGAGGVADAERGPADRVRRPEGVGAPLRRGLDDLSEQPVRRLDPPEPPVRLAEPEARLEHEVLLLAALRGLLERLRRVVVLPLGDARPAALECRGGDAEERADACERPRLGQRGGGLRAPRRPHRCGRKRRQVGGRLGEREVTKADGRFVERHLGERDERGEIGRGGHEGEQARGARGRRGEQYAEDDRGDRATPHDRRASFPGLAGVRPSWLFTTWARSRAQSRSVASGLPRTTDSYAVRAPRKSLSCSRASPRPASAR